MSIISEFENNKSYTDRDINALRKKVVNLVRKETTQWSDFNDSDIGMVLLDVVAGLCDYCNFYLDKQANEVYLDRATEPKNIKSILNTLGYDIPFPKGAVGTVIFALPGNYNYNDVLAGATAQADSDRIIIPEWTQVSAKYDDNQDIVFCTTVEGDLSTNKKWAIIPVVQGKRIYKRVNTKEIKDCKLDLGYANIENGIVRITDLNGKWEQVKDAFLEYNGGRKYSVHQDSEGACYVLFTYDYENHLRTDGEGSFEIEYLETMGQNGNVPIMAIDTLIDLLYVANDNNPAPVYVRNAEAIAGGADTPDLYKMIIDCKTDLKQMQRCVTLQDYEDAALMYPGVAEAKACDINSNQDLVPNVYTVKVYLRSTDTEKQADSEHKLNTTFLEGVRTFLQDRGVAIVNVVTENADLLPIMVNVELNTYTIETQAEKEDLIRRIKERLLGEFGYGKLKLGGLLTETMVRDIIMQTSNLITNCKISGLENPVNANVIQYPYLKDTVVTIK